MPRPAVDVVVPFVGPGKRLQQLREALSRLTIRSGDSVLIVDNTPDKEGSPHGVREETPSHAVAGVAAGERTLGDTVGVIAAAERRTPGYARNRGAALGAAPWIVFLDADTEPPEDLLDRYFDRDPDQRTAVLAGEVLDEPVAPDGPPAARYAYIRRAMSQADTLRFGEWGFPKTANCAVRRAAFEAVGGFCEEIRTAEDADLNYRLRAAGWEMEVREHAAVMHRSRQTVRSFVAQRAMYGAGGAWLERRYPGSFPARRRPGLVWWAVRRAALGLFSAVRSGRRDEALLAMFEPLEAVMWEFGRSLPNDRPLALAVWWRALRGLRGTPGVPRI